MSWSDLSTCSWIQTVSTNTITPVCRACLGIMLKYEICQLDLLSSKHDILERMNPTKDFYRRQLCPHPLFFFFLFSFFSLQRSVVPTQLTWFKNLWLLITQNFRIIWQMTCYQLSSKLTRRWILHFTLRLNVRSPIYPSHFPLFQLSWIRWTTSHIYINTKW